MLVKPIAIASDHAGFELKAVLKETLEEMGYAVLDLGTDSRESVDYPDFADALAEAFHQGLVDRGVLVCGSGLGISIAANRHRVLRATPCHDEKWAQLARQHNDANVLALGARLIDEDAAKACLKFFLETPFEGGRHERRVQKLSPR
ncbi:MAG: ribose 5-phosphate isomerase B [Rhodospirillaceae bacterium]|nr:MAG: ribose 5-phosphate isomerase B [Rhodospirillaceae bacterium]